MDLQLHSSVEKIRLKQQSNIRGNTRQKACDHVDVYAGRQAGAYGCTGGSSDAGKACHLRDRA